MSETPLTRRQFLQKVGEWAAGTTAAMMIPPPLLKPAENPAKPQSPEDKDPVKVLHFNDILGENWHQRMEKWQFASPRITYQTRTQEGPKVTSEPKTEYISFHPMEKHSWMRVDDALSGGRTISVLLDASYLLDKSFSSLKIEWRNGGNKTFSRDIPIAKLRSLLEVQNSVNKNPEKPWLYFFLTNEEIPGGYSNVFHVGEAQIPAYNPSNTNGAGLEISTTTPTFHLTRELERQYPNLPDTQTEVKWAFSDLVGSSK